MNRGIALVRPYIKYIVLTVIASFGAITMNIAINHIVKKQIDSYDAIDQFWKILLQVVIIIAVGMVSNYFMVYLNGYYSNHIITDIRKKVIEHIRGVSIEDISNCDYGDMISRMSLDMGNIKSYAESYLKDCIFVPVMVMGFSVYLLLQNWKLFLYTMMPLIILVPLSIKLMTPIKFRQREYMKQMGLLNGNIQEICDGIITIKSYGLQNVFYEKYKEKLKKTLIMSQENDKLQYMVEPLTSLIMYLPIVICLIVGGQMVYDGRLGLGALIIYANMLGMLIDPLVNGYQLYVNSKAAVASIERVLCILDLPIEEQNEINITKETEITNDQEVYRFENVSFQYKKCNGREKRAVNEINLSIEKGNRYAIVGESGSGKTTLLKLLYRQCEDYTGSIKMYGTELNVFDRTMLRDRIALISQDSYLFPISIMDNIKMARNEVTSEEVIRAAKQAGAHDFILNLPKGYDTNAGEAGTLLSGGQRQRIAIARAVLKYADIILLDEPTSALDKEAEKLIMEMIDRVFAGKTVISVAHRLPSVKHYEKIIVMHEGRIREEGTHDELIETCEVYQKLWQHFKADQGDKI